MRLHMNRTTLTAVALGLALIGVTERPASAQLMTKAQVANLIKNVENGVDEFRNYLEKRAENTNNAASAAQTQGKSSKRKATDSQKANASAKKDALDDALGDLNRSTNRLRRKFDPTDKWMETKGQVENVLDDGRKINQVVARGSYGAEAARLWAALRTRINDLARAYGLQPLGV
jgi:flagellar basal body rod protein FlgC